MCNVGACRTGAPTGSSPAREGAWQERARAVREQKGAGGSEGERPSREDREKDTDDPRIEMPSAR